MDDGLFVNENGCPTTFEGYRLLLPSVSVGNVPQLALDLLINTATLPRVGWIKDDHLLPVVGGDAFDHEHRSGILHCAAEVFVSEGDKLLIVQIRSPVAKSKGKRFMERLIHWIKQCKFELVILLTSSQAHERRDIQLSGSLFRFLLAIKSSSLFQKLHTELGWIPLEPRSASLAVLDSTGTTQLIPSADGILDLSLVYLPGGGWAKHFYKECISESIQLVLIGMFCSQGDNVHDAVAMATHANQLLCLPVRNSGFVGHTKSGDSSSVQNWKAPSYWKCMYGNPQPSNLY